MRNNRKAIYQALQAQLQTILPAVQSISRVWRPHTAYAAAQLPAMILDEKKEHATVESLAAAPLYHLYVDLWVYLLAPVVSQTPGQETEVPFDALDDMLDILENSPLANPPKSGLPYNTLGGLVIHTWIEGDILKVAGSGDSQMQYSIARVPIVIFTT
jgi:hypothetical protein